MGHGAIFGGSTKRTDVADLPKAGWAAAQVPQLPSSRIENTSVEVITAIPYPYLKHSKW